MYLDGGGVIAKVGENGVATIANEENVDDDKRKVRRVEIARRVVALRPSIIISNPQDFDGFGSQIFWIDRGTLRDVDNSK